MATGDAKGTGSSVQAMCGLLVRYGFHARDAVKDIYRRWKTEPKVSHEDTAEFARWLVQNRYITEEQAVKLGGVPKAKPEPEKPAEIAEWDVELVKALPMQEIVISIGRLRLSRRDLVMLGIGAATVTAAGLISLAIGRY